MKSSDRSQYHWRIVFLIWFIILTTATHIPQGEATDATYVSPDKLLHMVCFGILAFSFMCTGWIQHRWLAWSVVAIWAIVDETGQHALPIGRPFSIEDIVAGQFGIASAMVWMGSLRGHEQQKFRNEITTILASPSQWIILSCIAILSTATISLLVWLALTSVSGTFRSGLALFIGVVFGACCVLAYIIHVAHLDLDTTRWRKRTAMPLIATILFAGMFTVAAIYCTYDPWVIALASLTIGCKLTWNHMMSIQKAS